MKSVPSLGRLKLVWRTFGAAALGMFFLLGDARLKGAPIKWWAVWLFIFTGLYMVIKGYAITRTRQFVDLEFAATITGNQAAAQGWAMLIFGVVLILFGLLGAVLYKG